MISTEDGDESTPGDVKDIRVLPPTAAEQARKILEDDMQQRMQECLGIYNAAIASINQKGFGLDVAIVVRQNGNTPQISLVPLPSR